MFEVISQELRIQNKSKKTIKAYIYHNKKFLEFTKKKPQEITTFDIKNYVTYLMDKNISSRTIGLALSALKFYYEDIMKRNVLKSIRRPKIEQTIPEVLEKEEIMKMIEVTKNIKHKLLIEMLYASGARISETLNLRKEDLLIKENKVMIRQGKGKKDRKTTLSKRFLKDYEEYERTINSYLFESSLNPGKPISERTAQLILENSAKLAGIKKHIHPHMLRRTFATHLYEDGVDLAKIKTLMGHSSIKTTLIYTKISDKSLDGIKSPLDD